MTKKKVDVNPLPKIHRELKKATKVALDSAINDFASRAKHMKDALTDDLFDAVVNEIDAAINQAYEDGFNDGVYHGKEQNKEDEKDKQARSNF